MLFNNVVYMSFTAQKMKFSIKDFFSKCDQIRSFLRIWSHLLKKSFMENFTFNAVFVVNFQPISHIFLMLLLLTFKKLRFIK